MKVDFIEAGMCFCVNLVPETVDDVGKLLRLRDAKRGARFTIWFAPDQQLNAAIQVQKKRDAAQRNYLSGDM